jgi:hypothetical protein
MMITPPMTASMFITLLSLVASQFRGRSSLDTQLLIGGAANLRAALPDSDPSDELARHGIKRASPLCVSAFAR